ncbi:unnamed protein product, partial [Ectocarpus sp. 12 AP-2014]
SESDQDSTTEDEDSPNLLHCTGVGAQCPAVLPQQEEESEGGRCRPACGRSRADDESLEAPASKRPKQHGHGNNYSTSSRKHERALPTEPVHSTPGRVTSPAHNTPAVGASASKSRGISQRAAANYNRFASATPTANTAAAVTR